MADKSIIVFPTDFSEFSAAALPWVREMAEALGAGVHCVYAVEEPQIFATLDMGAVPIPSVSDLRESGEKRLADFVDEHLDELPSAPVTAVLLGRPAEQIVAYASDVGARMIVMATHGYSGVRHVLLGSTTEAVLRHADCPVLSVRID